MKNNSKQIYSISKENRNNLNSHKSFVLWFTGLSGSGKSTIACEVEKILFNRNHNVYSLDGDNVRLGLNNDLGFSIEDRTENIRRVGEVAALMIDAGVITICAFISPLKFQREIAEKIIEPNNFIDIYISTPLVECEKRDIKGLYKKAREGKIKNFTGIDSPYEAPENPKLTINTLELSVHDAAIKIIHFLELNKYLL